MMRVEDKEERLEDREECLEDREECLEDREECLEDREECLEDREECLEDREECLEDRDECLQDYLYIYCSKDSWQCLFVTGQASMGGGGQSKDGFSVHKDGTPCHCPLIRKQHHDSQVGRGYPEDDRHRYDTETGGDEECTEDESSDEGDGASTESSGDDYDHVYDDDDRSTMRRVLQAARRSIRLLSGSLRADEDNMEDENDDSEGEDERDGRDESMTPMDVIREIKSTMREAREE